MQEGKDINVTKIRWSRAMSIEELSIIYNVHRNTMSKWLKNQIIRNRQLSPRKWQVAKHLLPNGIEEKKISDII